MCGITGILKFDNRKIDKNELLNFTKSLNHRGPDNIDFYINKNENLGLGHTRLSILDLSNLSDQPMISSNGRYVITFNGEIYNYLELRKELESIGYTFKTSGDTEVLLNAFIEWGEKCNFKFNGMWSYAIWDNLNKNLYLSRDRFGVKPLFYLHNNHELCFSSELKAFKKLNRKSIPDFKYSYFSSLDKGLLRRDTFLQNVYMLGPGESLNMNLNKKIQIKKWWNTHEHISDIHNNYNEQIEEFKELFFSSIKLRMRSDVDVATSLSGGLDSSSIFASINNMIKYNNIENQNIYSAYILNYLNENSSETKFALSLSNNSNMKHKVINLNKKDNFYDDYISSVFHQEAIGDDAIGPWNIFKNMKNDKIKVSIDGHGPDELLGGYWNYPSIALKEIKMLKNPLRWFDLKITDKLLINPSSNILNMIIHNLKNKSQNLLHSDSINNSLNNKLKKNYVNYNDENPIFYKKTNFDFFDEYNNELYNHFHIGGFQKILSKFDRLSMAHGVEVRCPFLDYRLVKFLFSIPSSSKIGNFRTKKILRDAMNGILVDKIRKRVFKKGFTADTNWFDSTVHSFINDTVDQTKFINSEVINGKQIKLDLEKHNNINLKNIFRHLQIYYLVDRFKDFQNDDIS